MINKQEITIIITASIVLAFLFSLMVSLSIFLYTLLTIFLVIMINVIAKKVISYHLDSKIEIKLWETKRWGFKSHKYFKKPFPMGIFLPILTTILSMGYFIWTACLTFIVQPQKYRSAKRHGLYTFSEMTEYHIGIIAASGIFANLIFAILGYLIGFEEFARLNIYYAFFNMVPWSDLDGNKIFFGSLTLWSFLATITLIALGYALLLI